VQIQKINYSYDKAVLEIEKSYSFSKEIFDNNYVDTYIPTKLVHHSATLSKRGSCWGNYHSYKNILIKKWGNIKTT
jgi:hypothetical protein